ncbi:hypothetical protein GCM10009839_79090 [Catenulispora yoronensis]|uniref:PE domain-containing protein n=1 Tax=Catenulispora yoronensis TaxID=450799 RepID=A0ABN2VGH6_9ACTN
MASHEQLVIDLGGIQDWGNALSSVRSGIDQPVEFASCDDQLGTDAASNAVQNALVDFDTAWKEGRTVIDSYMSALSKMCDDTVAKIRAMDTSLAPAPHHRRDLM